VRSDPFGLGTRRSVVSARREEVGRFSLNIGMLETRRLLFLTRLVRTLSSGARRLLRLADLQRLKAGVVDEPLVIGLYWMTGCFISENGLHFAPECFGLVFLLLVVVERHDCVALGERKWNGVRGTSRWADEKESHSHIVEERNKRATWVEEQRDYCSRVFMAVAPTLCDIGVEFFVRWIKKKAWMLWLKAATGCLGSSVEGYGNIRILFHVYENHRGQSPRNPSFNAAVTPETSC